MHGIDCPEMNTVAGRLARLFLVETLSPVARFVVTTPDVDLYDRYLADVFVLDRETDPRVTAMDGVFVNREMIGEGVARVWTDEKPEF
ncbi:TPA: hypothetical protein DCE37_02950 [Candidatus Latescibacteria bacterium]|nr:hypothetical protein [Candidatus Latescibacterota bacterium]